MPLPESPLMLPNETDVLIVGAGPTGLALATTLQQAGVRHVLIDKLAEGQNTSRAAVIHAHTLDMLDTIGVGDALASKGLKLSKFTIRDRDHALLSLAFDTLASRHAYLLMLPQEITEKVLAERLLLLGGAVHRGVTAAGVEQGDGGVEVGLSSAAGQSTIRARYVVGADGMHSAVRAAAGIAFEGAAYAESFVLADVELDWPQRQQEVSLFFSPAGLVVVAPLPDGSYRVVATLDDAPERPDVSDIQALIDARGPNMRPGKVQRVIWSSRFRVHHRRPPRTATIACFWLAMPHTCTARPAVRAGTAGWSMPACSDSCWPMCSAAGAPRRRSICTRRCAAPPRPRCWRSPVA